MVFAARIAAPQDLAGRVRGLRAAGRSFRPQRAALRRGPRTGAQADQEARRQQQERHGGDDAAGELHGMVLRVKDAADADRRGGSRAMATAAAPGRRHGPGRPAQERLGVEPSARPVASTTMRSQQCSRSWRTQPETIQTAGWKKRTDSTTRWRRLTRLSQPADVGQLVEQDHLELLGTPARQARPRQEDQGAGDPHQDRRREPVATPTATRR